MNATNFKLQTESKLQIELDAWINGEKKWNVSNQFDESIIESALQNLDSVTAEQWATWAETALPVMALAHNISAFEAPELESAWVN